MNGNEEIELSLASVCRRLLGLRDELMDMFLRYVCIKATLCVAQVNADAPQSRQSFKIEDSSLLATHAEMPATSSDDWEVESVVQYRMKSGVEQWLVKWKDNGEDRNTWEPWEHLGAEVQAEARRVRTAALPRDQAGLAKLVWW